MKGSLLLVAVAAAFLAGCHSKPVVVSTALCDDSDPPSGVIYSLPRQLVQIKFTREAISYEKLLESYGKQKTVLDDADKALAMAKTRVADLTAQVERITDNAGAKTRTEEELAIAKAIQAATDVAQKKAAADVVKARQALQQAVDYANALALYDKNKAAHAKEEAEFNKSVTEAAALEAQLAATPPPADAPQLRARLDELNASKPARWEILQARQLAVEQQHERVRDLGRGAFQDTFALQLLPMAPDPHKRFAASLREGRARHTKLELTTSAAGLLEGGIGTAESKQSEIIVETIGAIGSLLKVGKGMHISANIPKSERLSSLPKPLVAQWVVDPVAPAASGSISLESISADLQGQGAAYQITIDPPAVAGRKSHETGKEADGLYYRRPRLHTLIFKDTAGGYVDSMQLLLPNDGPIGRVEFPAYPWVTTDFRFVFKEGMLTSYKADVPSQALAIASTPAKALKAIIAIPTELVQLKIDLSKKESEDLGAQKAYIDSQIALIDAQMKLLQTQDAQAAADEERANKKTSSAEPGPALN